MDEYFRVRAELSKAALLHNIRVIKEKLQDHAEWMAVVKSNAYGHGVQNIVPLLQAEGCRAYAVATVEEGREVRQILGDNEAESPALILVLGYSHPSEAAEALSLHLTLTVYSLEQGKAIASAIACALAAAGAGESSDQAAALPIHIKLETGMGRIGFPLTEKGKQEIIAVSRLPELQITGVFTHFARADEKDKAPAIQQQERFDTFVESLEEAGISFPVRHSANSAAIMEYPDSFTGNLPEHETLMARSGIMLYGLYPSHEMDPAATRLKPVMSVKSHIVHIKWMEAGEPIGYGGTYITKRRSRIATVPIGYGDGYPRSLSNCGQMLVQGLLAPVVGRVCMDQTMIDITDIPAAKLLDEVEIFGGNLPVDYLADLTGTISYEIICQLTDRIKRKVID